MAELAPVTPFLSLETGTIAMKFVTIWSVFRLYDEARSCHRDEVQRVPRDGSGDRL